MSTLAEAIAAIEADLADVCARAERAAVRAREQRGDAGSAFADERTWRAQSDALRRSLARLRGVSL